MITASPTVGPIQCVRPCVKPKMSLSKEETFQLRVRAKVHLADPPTGRANPPTQARYNLASGPLLATFCRYSRS